MGGLGDGDGGDGLHGLDGHGDAEEDAGGDVVEGGEDEGGGEVEVGHQGEGQDDGDVGAEVADGAGELRREGGLQAEVAAPPAVEEEGRGVGGGGGGGGAAAVRVGRPVFHGGCRSVSAIERGREISFSSYPVDRILAALRGLVGA